MDFAHYSGIIVIRVVMNVVTFIIVGHEDS